MAETVRPHFHRYLVRWLNNGTPEAGLSGLARLFGHARRRFGQGAANDLFLAAEGVIEGLIDGSIVADAATKALVLRLDRILRSLTAVPPEWPRGLVMAMSRDLVDVLAQKSPASPALGELAHMHVRRLSEGGVPDDGAEPKSASRQDPRRATGALQAASGPEGDAAASGARRRAPLQGPAAVALRDARAALRGVGAELGGTERTQTSSGSLAALAETVRGIANALTRIGASEPAALLDGLSAELRQRVDGPGASSGEVDRALMQRAIAAIEIDLEERLERVEGDPRMRALAGDALKRLSHPLPRGDGLIGDSRVADPLPLFEASQAIDIESLGLVLDQAGGHPGTPLSESHRDTGEIAEARDGEPSAADLHPTADWLDQMIDGSAELDAIQIGLAQQNTRLALRLEQLADELKPLGSGAESLASLTGLRLETADLLHRHRDLGEALRRILLRSIDSDGESLAANMAWSRRRPKVLIVSDAQPVQPLTGRSLRREHIDVATETDPVAARTTLLQRPPDLLLIDLRRAVDGVALARHVRSADTLRYLPIVMLMSDDDESHSDALTAGADRILSAPFDQEVLLAWIERLLAPDAGPVGAVR
jgi:CheY-like chemotaxis protein